MKVLFTNCGKEVLVSDEDYVALALCNWTYDKNNGSVRESTTIYNEETIHRIIAKRMKLDLSNDIDHIDRNRLNNQRENLRSATHSQNCANREGCNKYKGVSWCRFRKKYMAYIKVKSKKIHLGQFVDDKKAALAYNNAALHYFGEFALLNEVL